jgi:ATP-dependent DNA helicase RecQ
MLHRVIESGLARQRNVGASDKPMYVVELSAAGVAVMKGEQLPPTSLADIVPRAGGAGGRISSGEGRSRSAKTAVDETDQSFDPAAIARFERLRQLRTQLARERDLPPYCICHDSTLKSIAKAAPDSLAKLEQIKGMGPYKVKQYGEQLIAAIREDAAPLEPRYVDEP